MKGMREGRREEGKKGEGEGGGKGYGRLGVGGVSARILFSLPPNMLRCKKTPLLQGYFFLSAIMI